MFFFLVDRCLQIEANLRKIVLLVFTRNDHLSCEDVALCADVVPIPPRLMFRRKYNIASKSVQ